MHNRLMRTDPDYQRHVRGVRWQIVGATIAFGALSPALGRFPWPPLVVQVSVYLVLTILYGQTRIMFAMSRDGLVPRRLGYFNTLLFPLIAAIRSLQRLTGKSADSDAALPSPGLNRLLTAIFGFERHLLPLGTFPFGTSVLAVLENPPCSPRP